MVTQACGEVKRLLDRDLVEGLPQIEDTTGGARESTTSSGREWSCDLERKNLCAKKIPGMSTHGYERTFVKLRHTRPAVSDS